MRYHHYAYRTENSCCQWILRYIHFFGGKTHPKKLGAIHRIENIKILPKIREVKNNCKNNCYCNKFLLLWLYIQIIL
ncbi:MAG: hypothetical protein ACC651_13355 [Candidatus Scalindua sp.]